MKQIFLKSKSFTLIELLVAAAIFVILMTMGVSSFSTAINARKHQNVSTNLQEAGRLAMEMITKEVENADMELERIISWPGPTGFSGHPSYGFRIPVDNKATDKMGLVAGPALDVYKPEGDHHSKITFGLESGRLTKIYSSYDHETIDGTTEKNRSYITAPNINVTELYFNGFQKTINYKDSYLKQFYQQPYVTINMTLQDTKTNETADFQTTVSPKSYTAFLPSWHIQAGNHQNAGDNIVSFLPNKEFSSPPTVLISANWIYNEDSDQPIPKVYNVETDSFTYDGGFWSRQSEGFQCGTSADDSCRVSWAAIESNKYGQLEAGFKEVAAGDSHGPFQIDLKKAFSLDPIPVFSPNWYSGERQIPRVQNVENDSFEVFGDVAEESGECGDGTETCGFYWAAISPSFPLINGQTIVKSGFTKNKASCIQCIYPEYMDGPTLCYDTNPPFTPTAPFVCSDIIGKISFPGFTFAPAVVVSRNWFRDDDDRLMTKIYDIRANSFKFYGGDDPYNMTSGNIGGEVEAGYWWLAVKQGDHQLKWSYK